MRTSSLSGRLFGATALALASAWSATAQQAGTQTTGQQTETPAGQQATGEATGQDTQQQATQEAGAQQGGDQGQQAIDQLREHLQQARQAVQQQDLEQAEQALMQAEQALEDARSALQQGGQQQSGITVTVVPPDQQEGQQEGQQQAQQAAGTAQQEVARLSQEETYRLLGMGDRELGEAAEMLTLTPVDLEDRDVVTMDGEEVGEVANVVSSGGQLYAIIEHGGFLGIGEAEVAIPLERIGMRGEDVTLLGLTEQQLEAMPDYDFAADEEVANEQSIEIGRYE